MRMTRRCGLGRHAQRAIAARAAGANQGELMAGDEDLGDDHRAALGQALGERVDEHELAVGVEHVGEARAVEPDPAGQALAGRVGDEVDLGQAGCRRVRMRGRRPGLPEDQPKTRPDRADHRDRMRARTTRVRATKVPGSPGRTATRTR